MAYGVDKYQEVMELVGTGHLHRLLVRYREGGLDALEPRSRRPKTTPIATPTEVRLRVVELRSQLSADTGEVLSIHQIEPDKI